MKKILAVLSILFISVFCITRGITPSIQADPWDLEPIDLPAPEPVNGGK